MLVDSHGFTYEVNFKQLALKLHTGDVESAQKASTLRLLRMREMGRFVQGTLHLTMQWRLEL